LVVTTPTPLQLWWISKAMTTTLPKLKNQSKWPNCFQQKLKIQVSWSIERSTNFKSICKNICGDSDTLHHKLGGEVKECKGAEVADSWEAGRPLLLVLLQTQLTK
jgi:hypothetical protein